jgi:hypothetical protein
MPIVVVVVAVAAGRMTAVHHRITNEIVTRKRMQMGKLIPNTVAARWTRTRTRLRTQKRVESVPREDLLRAQRIVGMVVDERQVPTRPALDETRGCIQMRES